MKLLTLIILSSTSLAFAQRPQPSWERISQHDSDKDGKVSKAEFKGPDMAFTRFDTDKDGFVTKTEMESIKPGKGGGEKGGGSRPDNAPAEGTQAPQLKAQILDGDTFVDLGAIKKTTVLIFGSYT